MCGRYAASAGNDDLVEEFDVVLDRTGEPVRSVLKSPQDPPAGSPDHNVAPSKNVRVVLERVPKNGDGGAGDGDGSRDPVRQLRLLTWGLVPSWAKDPSVGARMTNARAETVLDKPAFRKAALARRAIVPADGWYEWQKSPTVKLDGKPRKQPFFIHRADGAPVALAGLYEFWKDPSLDPADPVSWLTTVTIVTTAAEPGLDRIHDRQPLVLEPEDWGRWLGPGTDDPDEVAALLAFATPGRFDAYPVGRAVGSSRVNGAGLLEPAPPEELQGVLDPATGEIVG
ncbi:SOS response-associated peptidase [Mobilicoccus caccae]|uniref:Abasic site processing protein n=1 Tax=Mobilicoccus caccae TaxID=1859295 RepID=A0ABQ6IN95_9MICO|nr:SOS response-associated peptidase [Mobilicoccus caccae]GMA38929.1 DUF159 family protein [Mobilicoccus caccae]